MLVVIDNYDSFTYNLVQAFGAMGAEVRVVRNDSTSVEALAAMQPSALVISPGSARPEDAGISCDVIREFAGRLPILGVGLGHHCIAHVFGAAVAPTPHVQHGKTARIHHNASWLYEGVPSAFSATCYHSRLVDGGSLPSVLQVTARDEHHAVMGMRHESYDVEGVQFHPESILTEWGPTLLANFARRSGEEIRTTTSV